MARRWTFRRRRPAPVIPPRPAEPPRMNSAFSGLVASATAIRPAEAPLKVRTEKWQADARAYAATSGETSAALRWKAAAMSRVRLRAARIVPGSDEPEFLDSGPAADLMNRFAGGIGGQAQIMRKATMLLDVPGDSYLVGVGDTIDDAEWDVYDPLNIKVEGRSVKVRVGEQAWTPLRPDAVIARIYNEDPTAPWLATSPVRGALHILREIDLYDRAITAILTSRIASNGILAIPQGATLARGKNGTAPNWIDELIEAGGQAMSNPGSALAAMPLPIELPPEAIAQLQHLRFTDGVSKDLIEARDRAIHRLATSLDTPAEVLTGMGQVNHWTGWIVASEGLKVNIAPTAETICDGITKGYLLPALQAAGEVDHEEDGTRYVVWYDMSELEVQPNIGEVALQLYDRAELSGRALRARVGLDESDAPTVDERNMQIAMQMARSSQAQGAYELLTGREIPAPAAAEEQQEGRAAEPDTSTGPATPALPSTQGDPPEAAMHAKVIELTARIRRDRAA